MVTVVFALAVANLGLGFALAVVLDRFPVWSTLTRNGHFGPAAPPGAEATARDDRSPASLPHDEWSQKLRAAEVDPQSSLERLLWIIKLETSWRRARLVELDRGFFAAHASHSIESELKQELGSFRQQLEAWTTEVDTETAQSGWIADVLEELLLDQAFHLRSCLDAITEADRREVARQFTDAMTAITVLRDRTDELLCELLTAEDRLHSIADRYRTFGDRSTLTRLGLAAFFNEWWADDPDHVRLVSLVMLDVDRFEPFTQSIGTARGDVALLRFGDMLHDLLRKERGFDRVARFRGQRFVMFLGDTSAQNAAKGAERVRQTIEATSFKLGDEISQVTASLAVIEVGKTEGPAEFLRRLETTLDASKKAGRNCGFVDSGQGAEPICLPQYPVSVRMIELDEVDEP